VATPIGHLHDVTLRALEILAAADLIACEDTRVTRKLLDRYGIVTPTTSYHDHNAPVVRPRLLERMSAGAAVALVSDAGTPLICDPGFKLVRAAHDAGIPVTAAPGPNAAVTALTVAGIATDRFHFEGFLPTKGAARTARIAALSEVPSTLVLFETGNRLAGTLADLNQALGAREAAICRELTKLHEEIRRGDLASLAQFYAGESEKRGEIVVVVGPAPIAEGTGGHDLDAMLRSAFERGSVREAVDEVAERTGCARREIYRRALAIKADDDRQ
jgi:16S rRNA (cytidine1402-2'-O)-methyltransferase